jgi:hypothetical protein
MVFPAALELIEEFALARCSETLGALGPHAPDQGVASAAGQQGQGSLRGEALECRSAGRRLGVQQRDERVLRIALARDFLRGAFGVHDAACLGGRRIRHLAERSPEAAKQRGVIADIAERRHAGIGGIEPGASEGAGLRYDDALDRRDRDIAPYAEALEDQPARIRKRDGTERWRRRCQMQDGDTQAGRTQRQRERAAHRARAANQNIKRRREHRASALRYPPAASALRR